MQCMSNVRIQCSSWLPNYQLIHKEWHATHLLAEGTLLDEIFPLLFKTSSKYLKLNAGD